MESLHLDATRGIKDPLVRPVYFADEETETPILSNFTNITQLIRGGIGRRTHLPVTLGFHFLLFPFYFYVLLFVAAYQITQNLAG